MIFSKGDHVSWESANSEKVFYGVIEGFYGQAKDMAMCTDQTGRPSRPVNVGRLRHHSAMYWSQGTAA